MEYITYAALERYFEFMVCLIEKLNEGKTMSKSQQKSTATDVMRIICKLKAMADVGVIKSFNIKITLPDDMKEAVDMVGFNNDQYISDFPRPCLDEEGCISFKNANTRHQAEYTLGTGFYGDESAVEVSSVIANQK